MPQHACGGRLWAITSYFNPAGYRSRLSNYRLFRERLAVPLVTVEWARDGRFALSPEDAAILVQVSGGDVLWQKERLLNLALGHLPDECDSVAWLDCDVIFADDAWPILASDALRRDAVVQLFQERCDLPQHADLGQLAIWDEPPSATSCGYNLACGNMTCVDLANNESVLKLKTTDGLAWAARRHVLARHGFYDACILGSGDRAMLCAARMVRLSRARGVPEFHQSGPLSPLGRTVLRLCSRPRELHSRSVVPSLAR